MESDAAQLLTALRHSYDTLAKTVENLNGPALSGRSFCSEWTIADVMSHLGSQAEIFDLMLDAGLEGTDAPAHERFVAIWDKWNSLNPEEQTLQSIAANDLFLQRIESLTLQELASFHLSAFGRELSASDLFRMRLFELSVHTWDVEVVIDNNAKIPNGAVQLLIDYLPHAVARSGKPLSEPIVVKVAVSNPDRIFALSLGGVELEPWNGQTVSGEIEMPAESFLRLVFGRLDSAHTQSVTTTGSPIDVDGLRSVFQGM